MKNSETVFTKFIKSACVFSEKKSLNNDEILALLYSSLKLSPQEEYYSAHILTSLDNGALLQLCAGKKQQIKALAKDKNTKLVLPFWAAYKAPSDGVCCLISEYDGENFVACYIKGRLIASFLLSELTLHGVSLKIDEICREYGLFFDEIYTTKAELSDYFTLVLSQSASLDDLGFLNLYKQNPRFGLKSKLALSAVLGAILGVSVTTSEYFSHEYSKNLSDLKLKDLALKIDDLRAQKESLIKSQELPSLEIANKSDKAKVLEKLVSIARRAAVKISSISVKRQTITLIATSSEYVKISTFITLILDDFDIVSSKKCGD